MAQVKPYRLVLLAAIGTMILAPSRGQADVQLAPGESSDVAARRLFAEGRARYAANEYEPAKRAFLDAFARKQLPLLLYNAAQAARLASDYEEAIDLYRRYLLAAPDAGERAQCARYIADLEAYRVTHPRPHAEPPAWNAEPAKPRLVAPLELSGERVVGAETTQSVAQQRIDSKRPKLRVVGAVIAATALACLGIGGGLLGKEAADFDFAKAGCGRTGQCAPSVADAMRRYDYAGKALLGVGVALAVADIAVWVLATRHRRQGR